MRKIKEMKNAINEVELEKMSDADTPAQEGDKPENMSTPPDTETTASAEEGMIAELNEKLTKAEAAAAESLDKYQRTLAEFDNFRKRTQKEKASIYNDGASDVIKALLPVIDSFERALSSVTKADTETPVYTGVTLIYKQLRKFMEDNGIAEIEAVGKEFNPELHQAISHVDDPSFGINEIIEELQKGYTLNDKVIRYSMVKVAN